MNWSRRDIESLASKGIAVEEADRQLALLRDPPKSIVLVRPVVAGDGIRVVDEPEKQELIRVGEDLVREDRVTKLVPASGAATRMFRDLAPALEEGHSLEGAPARFFRELRRFPFIEELERVAGARGLPLTAELSDDERRSVLRLLLTDEGLDYGRLAKGLIPFHRYRSGSRTAFEEQVREGVELAATARTARFHFTVPEDDRSRFESEAARLHTEIEARRCVPIEITLSVQHPATDTIAATPGGEPFRDEDGALLFRPGGHGALLRNLMETEGDVVFLKNIDNVRPEHLHREIADSYLVLIGLLARLETRVRNALRALEEQDDTAVIRAEAFVREVFARPWRGDREDHDAMRRHVMEVLRRPLRVCAVVKNQGEPGGAPFWVREADGHDSIQIVESSQVDRTDSRQERIFASSTHFNPVAIACSLRDPDGVPYDLTRFVNPAAAIVARKTHGGRELLALEHPGLWNGSMAGWNTICVETPASTFAPVKTVFDLLRAEHRTEEP